MSKRQKKEIEKLEAQHVQHFKNKSKQLKSEQVGTHVILMCGSCESDDVTIYHLVERGQEIPGEAQGGGETGD